MAIQIYYSKNTFDVQKAQRFFKERRIQVQEMDLKKHRLGERELQVFARGEGLQALVDRENPKVKAHPACYYDRDEYLIPAILENQWMLRSPIVRCGQRVTVGYQPDVWETWIRDKLV